MELECSSLETLINIGVIRGKFLEFSVSISWNWFRQLNLVKMVGMVEWKTCQTFRAQEPIHGTRLGEQGKFTRQRGRNEEWADFSATKTHLVIKQLE
jgi:hypothetical protein